MRIGPKYKIARRLGPIFEKTQTPKYALRAEKKAANKKRSFGPKSEFASQMLEKQKVRYSYGIGERQFKKYVKEATARKGVNTIQALFERLEMRLDNTVYRLGFAPTRQAARQMVGHGHITVNGIRSNVPSHIMTKGDVVAVRAGSVNKPLFKGTDEKLKTVAFPSWLSYDADKKVATVSGVPQHNPGEQAFNLGQVIEFYSR
jgi:small subunit ribosomal protein S4